MKFLQLAIKVSLLIFIVASCSDSSSTTPTLTLDSKYKNINTISSFANCSSSAGTFTTEVRSSKYGDCIFIQWNSEDSIPFIAQLTKSNEGFILDEAHNIIDTLSEIGIEMIRGHEIHRIISSPESFYSNIQYDSSIELEGRKFEVFSATDGVNNPIKIFYNNSKNRIKKVELVNPLDSSQVIEIVNNAWMSTEYGKMPKEVDIIQAKKDTYRFSFNKVEINQ